jgi:hypothetical protein
MLCDPGGLIVSSSPEELIVSIRSARKDFDDYEQTEDQIWYRVNEDKWYHILEETEVNKKDRDTVVVVDRPNRG